MSMTAVPISIAWSAPQGRGSGNGEPSWRAK
jgi:hypothetical protein